MSSPGSRVIVGGGDAAAAEHPKAGLPGFHPGSATQWLCVLGNHLTCPSSLDNNIAFIVFIKLKWIT